MELSKLLLKILYLAILYVFCYIILKNQTPLDNMNLIALSFFLSVLVMYVTFEQVYAFLTYSEIIFKQKGDEEKEKEEEVGNKKGKTHTEIDEKVKVHNKSVNDYIFDHTHKYIEDSVF
tara:strand:- start:778 stop:1134 length:357 start_codon:yes stop_codon:yes gene_type:complete